MNPHSPHRREQGYLLVECLIYATVLMVVIGLALSAFYRGLDNSRDLVRNADDIVRALNAGEQWRTDIREAIGPPEVFAEGAESSLEIPKAAGTVVYLYARGVVWRRETALAPWRSVLAQVKMSRMERQPRAFTAAWAWDVELQTKKKQIRVRPLFSFLAVPPKDLSR